ncbi:MAG: DsbA family protein [Gemmatimonadaceae bacterium]
MSGLHTQLGGVVAALVTFSCAGERQAATNERTFDSVPGSAPVTTPLEPSTAKADSARIMGQPSAATWFIVVSDFQCPYCKQWHDESGELIRREYVESGKVRMAYINYPLGQHRHAVPTAEAALCAGVQQRFWPYHDALLATQKRWQDLDDATNVLDSLARATGLDAAAHKECRDGHTMLSLIAADEDRARTAGAQSTPTFLVGGEVLRGVVPIAVMRQVLDRAVAAAGPR